MNIAIYTNNTLLHHTFFQRSGEVMISRKCVQASVEILSSFKLITGWRHFVPLAMKNEIVFRARHVASTENSLFDAVSHTQLDKFH